jgi:hypothetical protein
MSVKRVISDEVMRVLRAGKVDGNTFYLPEGQLERKLYEATNKVLTDCGGKWNRKAKGHVFASDPSKDLGLAIETGVSVNKQQLYQEFFTPAKLAAKLALMAEVRGKEVLEPSAGEGRLADACKVAGAKGVMCVELQEKHCKTLAGKGYDVRQGDFTEFTPLALGRYERVVMNPPFTKGQDMFHVRHALRFLKPGGILVAIVAGGKKLDKDDVGEDKFTTEDVPEGAFKREGTGVRTMILKVTKPKARRFGTGNASATQCPSAR